MRGASELAEAIGVFALVFVGCGAIMTDALFGGLGTVGIAMAFGLVIAAMVYAAGHVSGAHFNPAVTIAFAATGHFPWQRVPSYIAAQAGGATSAAFLLRFLLGDVAALGATLPAGIIGPAALIIIEVLLTAMLMFVIASVATDGRATGTMAGVAIGAAVAMAAMSAGPLTGASMNPARSLGPALASAELSWMPFYIVGPLVGALLGGFAYEAVRRAGTPRGVRSAEAPRPAQAVPGDGPLHPAAIPIEESGP